MNGRVLASRLRKWLTTLDPDRLAEARNEIGSDSLPHYYWEEHGLKLTFTAFPKSSENRGKAGVRTIGISGSVEASLQQVDYEIKSAVEGKAKKYGKLQLPLILAINVLNDFFDETALWDALFGREQTVVTPLGGGRYDQQDTRQPNGAWWGRKGPRNKEVSAVIIADSVLPSTLRKHNPILIHNPWADLPLDRALFPISYCEVIDGALARREGTEAADLLRIPTLWPTQ